jgi:hypothetical protein
MMAVCRKLDEVESVFRRGLITLFISMQVPLSHPKLMGIDNEPRPNY